MTPLIVPGLHGSGASHWQTWLEHRLSGSRHVEQPDWTSTDIDLWSDVVRESIELCSKKAFIIAHSFGCLATIDVLRRGCQHIGAVLLVAPADPRHFSIPDTRFAARLSVPAILVASHNDPWMSFEQAAAWSQRLGCWLFDAGRAGHVNIESGHGPWPEVLDLVAALARHARPHFGAPPRTRDGRELAPHDLA